MLACVQDLYVTVVYYYNVQYNTYVIAAFSSYQKFSLGLTSQLSCNYFCQLFMCIPSDIHVIWLTLLLALQAFGFGQKLLEKQRFQFPHNWLYTEQVDGEWGAFNDIMNRKEITRWEPCRGRSLRKMNKWNREQ